MIEIALVSLLALSLALYATLGGADFGGGILDLLARGPASRSERRAIAIVMGPVWEANHVWLIFSLTTAFAVFPPAFAVVTESLYVPFGLALIGIVFRGAAFAFRSYGEGARGFAKTPGRVFGAASLMTPLCLGASAGALASGRIHVGADGRAAVSLWEAWTGPLSAIAALMAVCACTYLAAAYMAYESARDGDSALEHSFRRKALRAGGVVSVLSVAGIGVVRAVSPIVWAGLGGRAMPLIGVSAIAGAGSMAALALRRYAIARVSAAVAIASVLGGWVMAQWPLLVVYDVTVEAARAPAPVCRAVLVGALGGAALLIPALMLLYRVFGGSGSKRKLKG